MRLLAMLGVGAVVLSMAGSNAAAGGEPFQVLEIEKIVEGTPPPGTEFVIEVQCDQAQGPPITETLTFTGSGIQTVDAGGGSLHCEANETEDGGAVEVVVSCEAFAAATCVGDNAIDYTSDVASARVTFTNRFESPPPPPPAPVEVEPAFTG